MKNTKTEKRFYTPKEAAELFGFAQGTLANLRSKCQGCKFYKRGRKVLYSHDDLINWLTANPVLTKDDCELERE